MLVKLKINISGIGKAGETVEVPDQRGANLVLGGCAEPVGTMWIEPEDSEDE
jgi:hypothetical protein